ncbi:hypothetical protein [Lactococcus petauri]|uniref:hypothetical protein n=1 Tax=Lactococcus petauri TaxID=1940789 RepID=UPI002551C1B0|nr:hypothetical protein [Lactococcus petauri]
MTKEELTQKYRRLADEIQAFISIIGKLHQYNLTWQEWDVLFNGESVETIQTSCYHIVSWLESCLLSGQLTRKEVPDGIGVFVDSDWMKSNKVKFEAYRMQGVKALVSHMSEETYALFMKDMKGIAHKAALISALCLSLSKEIDCYVSE